jgi:hypothetical protein
MKSRVLLFAATVLCIVSVFAANACASEASGDSAVSGDDFSTLEQQLEEVIQEGKLSLPGKPGDEEEPAKLCEGMFHRVTYSAKGTRSEARHGHLEIEGYALPDVFTELSYQEVGVSFYSRSHLWGDDGYWPDARVSLPEQEGPPLSEEAKERGWILADKVPADIPEEWVWVKWKDGSAFVDAESLKDFINEMELPLLQRHMGRMEMPREELTLEDQSD